MSKSLIERLETLVDEHGEAHVTMDGEDAEVELRRGTTTFDIEAGVIVVDGPDTTHFFPAESVLGFYAPREIFHD